MTTVDVPDALWPIVAAAAVLAVIVGGFPFLLRGGGLLRRGRRRGGRRDGYTVRFGPSLPMLAVLALVRRLDTVALWAVTVAFLVAVVLNARA